MVIWKLRNHSNSPVAEIFWSQLLMLSILTFEYRCLLPVFLVINLLQVGFLRSRVLENYLSVPRTEDRRNTEEIVAEIKDQKKM